MSWATSKLGDVCELIKRGVGPRYVELGGICVINQKCVRGHQVNFELARRHDLNSKKVNEERYVQVGDVLVNSTGTGTLGRVAQIRNKPTEPTTVDTHVTIVRPKLGLFFDDFFGYMLIKIEEEITSSGEGASGQTELSRTKLENDFFVSYPNSIGEQKRIVAILDQAFSEIEQARVNTEQNLKNARELVESYLQQIFSQRGEGWVSSELSQHIKFIDYRGKTPTKTESGLRLITAKNVRMGYLKRDPEEFVAPDSYDDWMTRGIPQKGDVLFTTEAPLANVAQLDTDEKVVFAQRIITMQPDRSIIDSNFLKYLLMSQPIQRKIHDKGTGATATGIKASLLKKIVIQYPSSINEQLKYVEVLDQLVARVNQLEDLYSDKLKVLDELKKSLLQKAFSGELTNSTNTSTPEFSANVIALAYCQHETNKRDKTFGRVKAQKLLHLVESIAGIELGRKPIKDAAGPNDSVHMRAAENWAKKEQFFEFKQRTDGVGYNFIKLKRFDELLASAQAELQFYIDKFSSVVNLLMYKNKEEAEIFATVHAAWNNLIIDNVRIDDDSIIYEARNNWHPDKLKISEQAFRKAIQEIKNKRLEPDGKAKYVGGQTGLFDS